MRTMAVGAALFQSLEDAVVTFFFPEVFGWKPDDEALRRRCALPSRHGGLGIPHVVRLAEQEHSSAAALTETLADAVLRQDAHHVEDQRAVRMRRAEWQRQRDLVYASIAEELEKCLSGRAKRGFQEARMRGGSAWLVAVPLESLGLDLDALTFRDAVALRMGMDLPDPLPSKCPSCGAEADLGHFLKCKRGGWVWRRHLEVLRAWKAYLEKGGANPVVEEPYLLPVRPGVALSPSTNVAPDARADIVARDKGRDRY